MPEVEAVNVAELTYSKASANEDQPTDRGAIPAPVRRDST